MSYVVTGATGHLGRLVVEDLLRRGVPATEIVAAGRSPEKLADLAALGVTTRTFSFEDTAALGLAAGDKVLLVSGNEMGKRAAQHTAFVDAAKAADVALLAYTSLTKADTAQMVIGPEHAETERVLAASGLPVAVLRDNWYFENWLPQVPNWKAAGALLSTSGDGKVYAAPRADYAAAAGAVLTGSGHEGQTYELGGDTAVTMSEVADSLGLPFKDLPADEFVAALTGAGVPAGEAEFYASMESGIRNGDLDRASDDLSRLIGRPTGTWAAAIA